jgi:hypothetical protein
MKTRAMRTVSVVIVLISICVGGLGLYFTTVKSFHPKIAAWGMAVGAVAAWTFVERLRR